MSEGTSHFNSQRPQRNVQPNLDGYDGCGSRNHRPNAGPPGVVAVSEVTTLAFARESSTGRNHQRME